MNQTCRFYNNGYCRHGDKCWYRHTTPTSAKAPPSAPATDKHTKDGENEDLVCSICFEEPTQFGLLSKP
ncbi:hypothetical protein FRC07_007570 [Ceratobasidium sp. 392]|nr:hypothetical protein FRC07_007570 [Ceratobasidium sp. 392]